MKLKIAIALAALWGMAAVGNGQTVVGVTGPRGYGYWGYPYGWSSTLAEGYGRGVAAIINSFGDYNLATSAAALNWAEFRRREIANSKFFTQVYFEMREINRQERLAQHRRDRGNPADYARYAQLGRPKPLGNQQLDVVTGEIRWPLLLTMQGFAFQRAVLEKAFADRAYHGVMGAEDYLIVRQLTSEMIEGLRDHVAALPPQQYLTAKRFLESLAYQAAQPAS